MEIELVKVQPSDIELNTPLPFSIFTVEQSLLLKKNTIVTSEKQLDVLLEKGVYRNLTEQEIELREALKQEPDQKKLQTNPFTAIAYCNQKLFPLLQDIAAQKAEDAQLRIAKIAKLLRIITVFDPNAALGAIHLLGCANNYAVIHSIYTAVLSGLLGRRRQLSDEYNELIISAALTMNLGMLKLQDQLYQQETPLTSEQRQQVIEHPKRSVLLLKYAGIESKDWLTMVLQHHEKNDGSGYPNKLKNESICEGAKIIALADIYTSLITGRKYRAPVLAHEAIKTLFAKRGSEIDEQLANQFIRETGVYPPGTFVSLQNGEIALITKRAVVKNSKTSGPYALGLISPRGASYRELQKRDCGIALYKIGKACSMPNGFNIDQANIFWGY